MWPRCLSMSLSVLQHLLDADERQVVAGHRDEHLVGERERVLVEQRQRRAAVEDHVLIAARSAASRSASTRSRPVVEPRQEHLGRGQRRVGGDDVEVAAHRHDHVVGRRRPVDEHVVERALAADAERGADVALRVDVDEQHVVAALGDAGGEVDRGRGLAGAALLVEDGDRRARAVRRTRRRRAPPCGSRARRSSGASPVENRHLVGELRRELASADDAANGHRDDMFP